MGKKVFAFFVALVFMITSSVSAQEDGSSYRKLLTSRVRSGSMSSPQHLSAYVKDGKLRLSLRDAILLTLENNSGIQVQETSVEAQKFVLLSSYQLLDPSLQSKLDVLRSSYSGYNQLQGVGTSTSAILNTLTQTGQINYLQTFTTGTSINVGISSSKSSTNSSYYYLNPYFSSAITLQFVQPFLRNAGRFANTALITIARRNLSQSREFFESQVNDAILQVVSQYWAAVQARGALDVQQRAQDLAEASYQRDKRALELGALPPLDISRSQAEVASRKVQAIQTAYALSQAEEALRLSIGADQDPQFRALALELTESPQPGGDLLSIDVEAMLAEALAARPEVSAATDALSADATRIRYAHNQLKPDLSFSGMYSTNGLGGNLYDFNSGSLISTGGFGASFSQMFGFGYPTYEGTLSLKFPIKNRAAQAQMGDALVSRSHDLYNQRQTAEFITREVQNAAHQLEEAKLALAAASVSVDLAKKTLAADQRKFELGAETNFFVLDSQSRLAQAELVLLQSQVNYQLAVSTVDHARGQLLAAYRVQVDSMSK